MPQRLIIAGGGLSGVLAALAFADARPELDILLLEAGPTLGGNHTWSFYTSDLAPPAARLVGPLVAHRWPGYEVRFKAGRRALSTPYRAVSSTLLHEVAAHRLGPRVRTGTAVASLDAAGVTLKDGTRVAADAVLDARGASAVAGVTLRWQKFLGLEVRLAAPHGLTRPVIMDATVPQVDGYRFVYLLPFSADTILIEDTYYAEAPTVDAPVLRARAADYAAAMGWRIEEVLREESGALPLLLAADFPAMWRAAAPNGGAVPLGLRAGLFHPVTGYSLPIAARTAVALAARPGPISSDGLRAAVEEIARNHFQRSSFDRMLNRLLFLAGRPEDRHRVLARFHGLPQPLIERFYAGRLTTGDRMRILVGKPPVPVLSALRAIPEAAARSGQREPSSEG